MAQLRYCEAVMDVEKLSNAEIDEDVARTVMGWTPRRLNESGEIVALGDWQPTRNALASAHLLRHLWGSKRFWQIETTIWRRSDGPEFVTVQLSTHGHERPAAEVVMPYADDLNGFRCLAIAALKAYDQQVTP